MQQCVRFGQAGVPDGSRRLLASRLQSKGRPEKLQPLRAMAGQNAPWPVPTQVVTHRVTQYDRLVGDDFRHPLDKLNTSLLRGVPGLERTARNVMGPIAEQVLLLENIATSVKIGNEQLPSVHRLLLEAAQMLQLEPPELYVRQHPVPNAYTLAIAGRKPFIVIHTALLELLTPRELQAVLAHELGHLKCDHGLWLTVANVLASGTVSMLPVISDMVEEALMRWLRAAELTCDRAALLVAQDKKVVIGSLMKLAGGSPSFAGELNVDAFLEQARSYEEATSSVLGWYLRNAQTRALSHPLPVMRAREIDKWSQSMEYKGLLSKNKKFETKSVEFVSPVQRLPVQTLEDSTSSSSSSSSGVVSQ
ncbi:peptidase family M48-domain-containing protein [Dunaliella salina]|uniref:Peptidase family M48-domain-containing protein n=1 Tax=Dunaliella salina TaxID=3046 RepID=A0ABQ7GU69_DUNSA|nr:peptidase family M48-domain-containing protein [Dunaliella salina]|eukprot:KAF5838157.1 peptidase family M48-domain-containing protein [Dunaliella salina]